MVCHNCLWEQLQQAKQLQPDSNNNTTKLFLELFKAHAYFVSRLLMNVVAYYFSKNVNIVILSLLSDRTDNKG